MPQLPDLFINQAQTLPSFQMVRAWTFLYIAAAIIFCVIECYCLKTASSKRDTRFKIST